jgi:hypothetical protein
VLPEKDGFVSVTKRPLANVVVAFAVLSNVMTASGTLNLKLVFPAEKLSVASRIEAVTGVVGALPFKRMTLLNQMKEFPRIGVPLKSEVMLLEIGPAVAGFVGNKPRRTVTKSSQT